MKMEKRKPSRVLRSPAFTGSVQCRGIVRARDYGNRFAQIGSGYAIVNLDE